MKAITLDTQGTLRISEVPDPVPAAGEVVIDVAHAGVQWGDVLVLEGHFPTDRPHVPGFEAAGTITAVGPGVDRVRIGEAVVAVTSGGAFAERVAAPAGLALPRHGLDTRAGAAFGWVTPTAYDLIHTVGVVTAGDRVLIHAAAGGVGTRAAQFASVAGADSVGVVATTAQIEHATRFGYRRVVEADGFREALDGEEFDVILDPIGGEARPANVELLARTVGCSSTATSRAGIPTMPRPTIS